MSTSLFVKHHKKPTITACVLNTWSVKSKVDQVVKLLDDIVLDILVLTEPWLRLGDANQMEINYAKNYKATCTLHSQLLCLTPKGVHSS